MKGFGHLVYAGVGYLITMNILSIALLDITQIGILIGSIVVAIGAGFIQVFHAKLDKEKNAMTGKDVETKERRAKKSKRVALLKKLAILDLTISAIILMLFHIGLMYNHLPFFNPVFILIGFYLAFLVGGVLPDLDFMFGIKYHRDPTTHSALIGGFFATLCLFFVDSAQLPFCIIMIGITIGAAMHLFCDIIPEGSSGWQAFKALIDWSESPGDIRNIKEGKEQLYLVLNGLILIFFSIFLALRSLTGRLQFPSLLEGGKFTFDLVTISWFIVCIAALISTSLMQMIFSSVRKPKKTTK